MKYSRQFLVLLLLLLSTGSRAQPSSQNTLMQKGWEALVKDHDDEAFRYFFLSYEKAKKDKNEIDTAESLLYLGICSFGSSYEKGLDYAFQSLKIYTRLEKSNPDLGQIGRSKCLQLISTIYSRQKKYAQAKPISREVISILESHEDKSGTLGLAYSSLGSLYEQQQLQDSATYFYALALKDFEKSGNQAYLPNAYINIGRSELERHNDQNGLDYFQKALAIANTTENKQAQVSALLAIGKWHLSHKSKSEALQQFQKANQIAAALSDKLFEIMTVETLISYYEKEKNYFETSRLQTRLIFLKDQLHSLEREKIVKSLEVQFEVAEKNRKLALVSKEKEVARLTNYLLAVCIIVLLTALVTGYFYLKNRNKRDRNLLKTKEALLEALEKQRELEEIRFQNDLDHKESQLSAVTLQMLQKNELLSDIKTAIEKQQPLSEQQLVKMVNRHFEQNNSWDDFNLYFESINKNFYTRLKQLYPEISANDLKVCALIKLNLSIKEMASILNISPDSVKTARYRLRKKLQLAADENLTSFILSV